ncbi:hypothetical protein ACGFWD_14680 [Streptomyces sp. NPDC048448]|uniref:Uncharacterized protein n=1 Tax=Streptomyces kaempferi TaxID=333725 RepID=A0ABW3XKL9_9ACTN|nr:MULTISPECIES: hypothetical protein [unclassified Streptomyces]QIY63383.1 hypothetical protein HEP85_19275 [Streptomyces sp. RPA4-2]
MIRKRISRISPVTHSREGGDPAGLDLALAVARELHLPVPRAPEVALPAAVPQLMGLRTPATRPHRRKVPLNRLTALSG